MRALLVETVSSNSKGPVGPAGSIQHADCFSPSRGENKLFYVCL